jgi:cell division protease FtsH
MRLERFRRMSRHLPRTVRRHPRTSVAVVAIAVAVALAYGVAFWPLGAASSPSSAGRGPASGARSDVPSFTYSGTWSLLDLQRHIGAGEVVAVTAAPAGANASPTDQAGDQVLVAKTTDGQLIRIALNVSAADAASALSRMGYGGLLTAEAWKAIQTGVRPDIAATGPSSAPAASGGPADGIRSLLTLLVPVLLVTLLMVFLMRMVSRVSPAARDATTQFTTIMPPSKEATTATESAGAPVGSGVAMPPVMLADVAGCDEAKLELTETIEFLKSPERFHRLGARIPRGIMLWGPPGTGKTMLARAVASEAGVPFHYTSGSEFVEKYVGVGARRVRELFGHARKLGRGVIFFDEFDALGKSRGGVNSHEEREQTLNQLLVELDGFTTTDDIVVIAATNRVDILDPAVLRPGRFNRKIHVGLPDVVGRREILEVHARNKPLAAEADLPGLARKTYGFSGAQLADLLNEAAILAARRAGEAITPEDLHAGWLKVAVGTSRRRSMDERERSIIAAHEVGHAICGKVHGDKRKVEEISLFAHGEALGVTVSSQEDNDLPAESDLRAHLVALMGGRAAEELLFHEVTGGASNDFDKANEIATRMVTRWGMGRDPEATDGGLSGRGPLGFLVHNQEALGNSPNTWPAEVQAAATRAIRAILDEAYRDATSTLLAHMTELRRLAAYLVENERVDGETFEALYEGRIEVPTAASEWRPATSRPRAWAEIAAFAGRRSSAGVPVDVHVAPARAIVVAGGEEAVASPRRRRSARDARESVPAVVSPPTARDGSGKRSRRIGAPSIRVPGARPAFGRRRLRSLAAGYLHAAAAWLLASDAEADRS